jgi:hypothetical protein
VEAAKKKTDSGAEEKKTIKDARFRPYTQTQW